MGFGGTRGRGRTGRATLVAFLAYALVLQSFLASAIPGASLARAQGVLCAPPAEGPQPLHGSAPERHACCVSTSCGSAHGLSPALAFVTVAVPAAEFGRLGFSDRPGARVPPPPERIVRVRGPPVA